MHISADKVAEVIILARDARRGAAELDQFINTLTEDEQAGLVAVFWIGRGSFDAAEYDEAYATAVNEASTPTTTYLGGSPHLADHLEAGMDALGVDVNDAEDDLYRSV